MKVEVLTVNDIDIPRWRWWSNWIDVAVFDFGTSGYLLQMKVSRTNRKRFNHIPLKGVGVVCAHTGQAGDLVQMATTGGKQ